MGSEQSHALNAADSAASQRPKSGPQLQRGYTIAAPMSRDGQHVEGSSSSAQNSRPVSPPMSVCSDSELPYISYTNKPIGGKISINSINCWKTHKFQICLITHFFLQIHQNIEAKAKNSAINHAWR